MENENVVRAKEIEHWPLAKIKPYKRNAKLHPPEQVEFLASVIKRHGFDQPIVVDGKGVIIKGHGRWLAAAKLELPTAPVIVRADLSPAQTAEARLADNRSAEFGWDFNVLRDEFLAQVDLPDFDAALTGFNLDDILKQDKGASLDGTRLDKEGQQEWEQAAIKQVVLYFDAASYPDAIQRLDALMKKMKVESYTEVVVDLLAKATKGMKLKKAGESEAA